MSRDTKVYVGNLSSTTNRGDLEHEFGYYGRLINVWVAKSPPGFAYVEFEDGRDAEDSIKGLDGKELHGRRIRVERSHGMPRGRRDEGFGGGRGGGLRRSFHPSDRCYNCGETGHYAYDCDLYNNRRRGSTKYRSERRSRRSYSRSYSRSPVRKRRSRSASRSRSRSRRRRNSRSRSRSHSGDRRSKSYSRSKSRSRSVRSRSGSRPKNGRRSRSRSNS